MKIKYQNTSLEINSDFDTGSEPKHVHGWYVYVMNAPDVLLR